MNMIRAASCGNLIATGSVVNTSNEKIKRRNTGLTYRLQPVKPVNSKRVKTI